MAETARMAVFHGTGKPFEIREYPVPEPEPGAALIKIALANVCGSDLHYWRGEQDYARMGRPLPLNTGHEHVGTIAKLGDGVTTDSAGRPLSLGDRVAYRYFFPCGRCKACLARHFKSCPVRQANWLVSCEQWPHFQGGFGQYFYLRPNHAMFKLPPEITDEMAAGVNCAFTQVYAGLDVAGLKAGQTVVVQGAGGLGVYACAVAREMGAGRVIVIDGIDERLELARQFGADSFVDLREFTTPEARVKRVRELTDNWGGDVVLELVGHPGVVDEGLRMTAPEGTYLEIGNINVGWKAEFDPSWIIFGNRRIIGLAHYEAEHLRGALDLMLRTLTKYPWRKVVSHKYPLEEINRAFAEQDKGHVTRAALGAHRRRLTRGSSWSRRPSPSMLTASTVTARKMPGKRMLCGKTRNSARPSAMMLPQVGVSGGMPTPRNERIASSRMAEAQTNVAWTMSGASVLGTTWRRSSAGVRAPSATAAST
jgi:D-arabinose 1-dehydrogenase-like Zn-dependent alcohol dehydrogenase